MTLALEIEPNLLQFFNQLLDRRLQHELRVLGRGSGVRSDVRGRVVLVEAQGDRVSEVLGRRGHFAADQVESFHFVGDDQDALDALLVNLRRKPRFQLPSRAANSDQI